MPGELSAGAWVQPTICTDLLERSAVVREDIFGPCCHIRPFDSEEELLPPVNANRHRLSTAIWTNDLIRARRVCQQCRGKHHLGAQLGSCAPCGRHSVVRGNRVRIARVGRIPAVLFRTRYVRIRL